MSLNKAGNGDFLIDSLTELAAELKKHDIKCIVGGGFAQYIRAVYFSKKLSPRYGFKVVQRMTNDIDFFLTSDLITDKESIEQVKGVLKKLKYEVVTPYFQFSKAIKIGEDKKEVRIDLLTEPPESKDIGKVKMNKPPRVRPIDVKEFHAFQHLEAQGLKEFLLYAPDFVEVKNQDKFYNIYIPAAIHFIIMKLFAFRDRLKDEGKDLGRHHAFDIFSTIVSMNEYDWEDHQGKLTFYDSKLITESRRLVNDYFSDKDSLGVLRIRENKTYQDNRIIYNEHLQYFIEDIYTLFAVSKD